MALSTQRRQRAYFSAHAWAEPPPRWKFDVFLSFRGQDTRWGFISYLYHQLEFSQLFKTFMDDRELQIGSEITPELLSAIEHSHLAIVVLSPEKSFAEAFAKNEVKFSMDLKKVERWRQALRKVANLSGWVKENYTYERVLIEDIVKRVWEKVRPTITLYSSEEKLVGMDFRLGQMGLLLALAQKDVRFIGTSFYTRDTRVSKMFSIDDADSYDHLEKLAGDKSWFSEGSRIIVTTRDIRLLTEHRIELSFELPRLKNSEALELFSHKAFGKDQQEERCLELSKCFVNYAKGLPLALKTLGRSLYQINLDEWNSTLESLKRIPNSTIFDSLKQSYDALNDSQQKIFLDIAFFYKGLEKGRVTELLEYCYGFNFLIVINALIEKSLLTVDHHNNVGKHGLVQEMAWEIVRKDSLDPEEPGLYSRLCHHNDIFHVFTRNTGTEAIKSISLCLPRLEEADSNWNIECFSNMLKLRCLSKLRLIDLTGCKRLSQLPDLPSNRELEVLADECDSLKKLSEPSQQGTSTNLEFVRLTTVNCFGLIDNEGLNNGIFSLLRRLAAQRCGARLLYEQDMKNLLNPPTNIMKRSREYCDSEEAEEGESPSEMASGSSGKESIFKRLKA
ncbi:hypothetical protein ACLB2K_021853 [Fragaria x ananassa]